MWKQNHAALLRSRQRTNVVHWRIYVTDLIRFQSTLSPVNTVIRPQLYWEWLHQQPISLGVTGSKRWRHAVLLRRPPRRQLFAGKVWMAEVLCIFNLIRSIRVQQLQGTWHFLKFLLENPADKLWLVLYRLSGAGTDGVFRGWSRGPRRLRGWRVVNVVLASGLGHRWDVLNIECEASLKHGIKKK